MKMVIPAGPAGWAPNFASMARKKAASRRRKATADKQALLGIERGAKRAEQKAQGALDGRFRQRKVESKKVYSRKARRRTDEA